MTRPTTKPEARKQLTELKPLLLDTRGRAGWHPIADCVAAASHEVQAEYGIAVRNEYTGLETVVPLGPLERAERLNRGRDNGRIVYRRPDMVPVNNRDGA